VTPEEITKRLEQDPSGGPAKWAAETLMQRRGVSHRDGIFALATALRGCMLSPYGEELVHGYLDAEAEITRLRDQIDLLTQAIRRPGESL
jgi:hypothetical protein